MSFLFWAHIVCWVGLFIYVYSLITKNNNLKKEIDALQNSFENSTVNKTIWLEQEVKQ